MYHYFRSRSTLHRQKDAVVEIANWGKCILALRSNHWTTLAASAGPHKCTGTLDRLPCVQYASGVSQGHLVVPGELFFLCSGAPVTRRSSWSRCWHPSAASTCLGATMHLAAAILACTTAQL